jgi:hypothetical protein
MEKILLIPFSFISSLAIIKTYMMQKKEGSGTQKKLFNQKLFCLMDEHIESWYQELVKQFSTS